MEEPRDGSRVESLKVEELFMVKGSEGLWKREGEKKES